MGNVTRFEPPSRRIHPEPGEEDALNLDAVGEMAALECQLGLLSRVEKLGPGETRLVIYKGARMRFSAGDQADLYERLADDRDELRFNLGQRGSALQFECLRTLVEGYRDVGRDLLADRPEPLPDDPA